MTDERLLTVAQAAAQSGLPEHKVWNEVYKGALPVLRLGPTGIPRIRPSDLAPYLKAEGPSAAKRSP